MEIPDSLCLTINIDFFLVSSLSCLFLSSFFFSFKLAVRMLNLNSEKHVRESTVNQETTEQQWRLISKLRIFKVENKRSKSCCLSPPDSLQK